MQWQPIETAPKDGTKLLFLTKQPEVGSSQYNSKVGRVFVGRYDKVAKLFNLEGCYTYVPIKWQHLPLEE